MVYLHLISAKSWQCLIQIYHININILEFSGPMGCCWTSPIGHHNFCFSHQGLPFGHHFPLVTKVFPLINKMFPLVSKVFPLHSGATPLLRGFSRKNICCQKIFGNSFSFQATEMVLTSKWCRIQPEIQF